MEKMQILLKLILSVLIACCVPKADAYRRDTSNCDCVLLKNCDSFTSLIDRSNTLNLLASAIRDATCHFDGTNIYVCCAKKTYQKRHIKMKTKLDYLDETSGLNCPPSFGAEHNYDEYLKEHEGAASEDDFSYESGDGNDEDQKDGVVMCDYWGNCGRFKFPTDDVSPVYLPNHNHGYDHDQPFNVPPYTHHHHHHHHHSQPIEPVEQYPPFDNVEQTQDSETCGLISDVTPSTISSDVYPWITRLAYLNTTSRRIRYRCLGTLISHQQVLTAAHCVDNLVNDLRLIYVRVGDDANFQDFKIIETLIHPNYNEPLFNNDVALIRLANTGGASRVPLISICLPQSDSDVSMGNSGIVAGWSEREMSTGASATIRYINLPVMNNTECAIRYAKYSENFENSIVITPSEFCAKAEEPLNDVCEGDSGGPFMERSPSGRFTLLGIVAFGPKTNCGQSNLPGVYMRVSSYVEWIKANIIN